MTSIKNYGNCVVLSIEIFEWRKLVVKKIILKRGKSKGNNNRTTTNFREKNS
jgi:hypothetical protein